MYILGLNFSHNGSICLMKDGEIVFFLEEERLTHKKHDYLIGESISKISLFTDKIDYITFNVNGFHEFDDVTNKFIKFDADKLNYILRVYEKLVNKLDLNYKINFNFNILLTYIKPSTKVWIGAYDHHKTHAIHSFNNSGFDKAVCVVADGSGSMHEENEQFFETESVWKLNPSSIEPIYKKYNHRVIDNKGYGSLYAWVTYKIGFGSMEEGKTMGLSSYGSIEYETKDIKLKNNIKAAYRIQKHTEDGILKLIQYAIEKTGCKNVCISGGVGLNCVANYYYRKKLPKDVSLYCEPIASDAGHAIGSCLLVYNLLKSTIPSRKQISIYYGPEPQY